MKVDIIEASEYDVNLLKSIESIGKHPSFTVAKGEYIQISEEGYKDKLENILERYGYFEGSDDKVYRLKVDLVKHIIYRLMIEVPDEPNKDFSELTTILPKTLKLIVAERVKQLNKGFDLQHDRNNAKIQPDCLLRGALWYLLPEDWKRVIDKEIVIWPYIEKPTREGLIKNLVKGITMLLAHLQLQLNKFENVINIEENLP